MEERTLEIQELFELFKKKIWILVVITILTTLLGFLYASTLETMYRARVKVYVGDSSNVMSTYTDEEIKSYTSFMSTFKEIIMIDDFLDETLQKNHLELPSGVVRQGLSFVSAENSPILEINYTSADQIQSRDVLKALTNEYSKQAEMIMENVKVQIIDSVKVFTIEPNKNQIVIISFVVGVIASIGLILFIDYLDDRVYKKESLERLLPVPVLGQLPQVNEKEEK